MLHETDSRWKFIVADNNMQQEKARMQIVLNTKAEGISWLEDFHNKLETHQKALEEKMKLNSVHSLSTIGVGRSQVERVRNHMKASSSALSDAAAKIEPKGELSAIPAIRFSEAAHRAEHAEQCSKAVVTDTSSFVTKELIEKHLDQLMLDLNQMLSLVQKELHAASDVVTQNWEQTTQAFKACKDIFQAYKKLIDDKNTDVLHPTREDLWLAEHKYRNAVIALGRSQEAYQTVITDVMERIRLKEERRKKLLQDVTTVYADLLESTLGHWNDPTQRPRRPDQNSLLDLGKMDSKFELDAKATESELGYRFTTPLPRSLSCVRYGYLEWKFDTDAKAANPFQTVVCVLTIDWYLHVFKFAAQPAAANKGADSASATASTETKFDRQPSGETPQTGTRTLSLSAGDTPQTRMRNISASSELLAPSFTSSTLPDVKLPLPDTPLWSLDLRAKNICILYDAAVDPLTFEVGTPPDPRPRRRSVTDILFGLNKIPPTYQLRARTREEVDAWLKSIKIDSRA